MPKRKDIEKILIIGSGPIIIGQACEFDYSGTQAVKALREEGYQVVLVNSNPATIMTDPEMADRTYIEPLLPGVVAKIISKERPQALLPTLGGQTALNLAVALGDSGVLTTYDVELIGAKLDAIKKAEDRQRFKEAMNRVGLDLPASGYAHSMADADKVLAQLGLPVIVRPFYTLGGTGGALASTPEEFEERAAWGLAASPVNEILIEESIYGWKEFELEVMRDGKDNVVVICSIENFDPMGIHTGDSITVAPAQTLTDKEYQVMRDAALKIIREIGVDTGGSNIQFAVNPSDGRLVVIEMNPRVSRSSALASKATGFPIAKIAAKLAVGYTLDELRNDITLKTPASFEPALDYVVVKVPRFAFEKFPKAEQTLGSQMKSVGEVMSIGRTFKESLQKALRSLEIDSYSLFDRAGQATASMELIRQKVATPNWERLWYIAEGFRRGMEVAEAQQLSKIDLWFLDQIKQIVELEVELQSVNIRELNDNSSLAEKLAQAKKTGFSDVRLAELWDVSEDDVRKIRGQHGLRASFKTVDTCAAEFEAFTPYFYSTYEAEDESRPTDRKKIVILGSGPNRIGQGIEFDYCCVHAALALRDEGYETIMVNCNPETVSTDYDISDRLYFEPLTLEDVLNIIQGEKPLGVIVQFGGQTPLKLAVPLEREGVKILGTSPDSIDRAEDRDRFQSLVTDLSLLKPESGTARSYAESVAVAEAIGYPVVVRPSYVLGGRGMEIVYDRQSLEVYMREAVLASPKHPVLIDKFLEAATEIDVDAVSDGETVVIGGVMEHIEEAGIHSGDSACCLPPYSIPRQVVEEICRQTSAMALELKVVGLMNVQFAIQNGQIYVLEVNPRASRTVPFVSKATGKPLAKIASLLMTGKKLPELGFTRQVQPRHLSVKESVFPFIKLPGVDTILGPEMKSTGEVMGLDYDFGRAFAKSQLAAGMDLPLRGCAFLSVKDADKPLIVGVARRLIQLGFNLVATRGTGAYLREQGASVEAINKVLEGPPHIVDAINRREIDLVINTTFGAEAVADSFSIRRSALNKNVAYYTTISEAKAACAAIEALQKGDLDVKPLQEYYEGEEGC